MAEIALALGGSMLGATVQVVLEKFASHAIKEVGGFLGFEENLGNMKDSLETIKAYLDDADGEFEEDRIIKDWIAKVKRVNYEAEDLLDDLQYDWLRHAVEGNTQDWLMETEREYSSRIQKTQKRMDHILALAANQYQLQKLRKLTASARGDLQVAKIKPERETTSLMGDEKVIGRDDEKAQVIEQLMSEHEGVQVLTIYGMGGVGKTSLARYVYNDSKVIQKHFELKIWVCVSDNFDVKRLTSESLECALKQSGKLGNSGCPDYKNFDVLQDALKKELTGKNFLLVLDDVWNEERQKWEEFKKPFVTAEEGKSKSKILVTTRSIEIGTMMSSILKLIELKGLSPADFFNLFKRFAFDESISGSNQETLEEIGKEIVKKLKGVPLAAKTVGRLLKSNMYVRHWDDILNSELWKSSEGKDDIMPALRLSYQHLPGALKPCFAFLCLFPKDREYEERMVKQLWIANGFICSRGSKLLEDIATTYINTLSSMCMIQVSRLEGAFVVHDLLHDLAQMISKDEYFHIRGDADLENIPDNVRHLNISSEITSLRLNDFKSTFKNLRTLVVSKSFNDKDLHGICIEAKHLRALVMNHMSITKSLPKCHFRHLRYLDLSYTNISCLPESLCTFYNLQVLNVESCHHLNKFPVEIVKLVNLQHIYTERAGVSTSTIKKVGKLTSLQELCFHVSKETGRTMVELENMDNIRELEIECLENVSSKEEVIRARLHDKKHLASLILRWSSEIRDDIPYDEILCGLQPYKYLRILKIYNYGGAEFPPWMKNENGSLPTLGSLEYLRMSNCHALWDDMVMKTWILPSSLKSLYIEVGPNPPLFTHDELVAFISKSFEKLTSLTQLSIKGLPHITELNAAEVWQNMTSLKELNITNWMNLVSIPDLGLLSSLDWLYIDDCSNLESLPADLNQLSSLQGLEINGCPKIKSLPNDVLPPSLNMLDIRDCSNLESLPADLNQLSSLWFLKIEGCPKIKSLPNDGLPPSLRELIISDCPLLKESCQKDVGSDWPKISNIPDVEIN